ncbi:hypothetical protein [Streptomyces caatingaensis]|uniref:Uncharacterized protein n=1 Tax=Streptomyces caatingaensis TaxID=1678637 RepID=A0A0K9XHW3_9ACTN|nr:hypothetical protein [Streptomyces caatingaensis]KNB52873.1 hypothetical protein AC230_09580 [Streptomyces caatingaensis]
MSTPAPIRVLRGTDLLDLGVAFAGLRLEQRAGGRRLVREDPAREGLLVVAFGPQHVTEHAFAADAVPPEPRSVPVGALIAGRSVLVFEVGPDDVVDWSTAGLLDAMRSLPLRVVDAALEADGAGAVPPRVPENPLADPARPRTGIELPYRLLLSPPAQARWVHRTGGDEDAARAELWHTRLLGRTVRAVWNRDRDAGTTAPEVPGLPLTPQDRREIVELTARDAPSYVPSPVGVPLLMLSAAGGWLEAAGQWPLRPAGIDLSDWRQQTTLGRDHYVRVMREGYLCPFGHRAAVVTVVERKVTDPRAAFLFRRVFVVVRQPLRTYDPARPLPTGNGPADPLANLLFPFTSVRLDTLVTPDLTGTPDPPDSAPFFPATATEDPFRFKVTAVDHEGRSVEFRTPLQFVPEHLATGDRLAAVVAEYNARSVPPAARAAAGPPPLTSAELLGQAVALAPPDKPGDTSVDAAHLVWGAAAPPALAAPGPGGEAQFVPQLSWASAALPAVAGLTGNAAAVPVVYARRYALSGFARATAGARKGNPGEVFLSVLTTGTEALVMDFESGRDRSGGLVAPSFDVAGLSRISGPVAGAAAGLDAVEKMADGRFDPADFFHPSDILGLLDANFLGVLSLADIVEKLAPDVPLPPLHVPNFLTQTVSTVTGFLSDLRRTRDLVGNATPVLPPAATRVRDTAARLAQLIADFLAHHPAPAAPVTLQDLDAALADFTAALDALTGSLPPGADPGVRALLDRVRQQTATWTTPAGAVPALRDALQQAARGVKLPETVATRLEWNPVIRQWPADDPVFVPHPRDGRLSLVADLRGSLRPDVPSGADVSCSLERFDLVLVPGFPAMRLTFDHVRLVQRAGHKPEIDVGFTGLRFTGPLSFVETLRKLIPADGFSDPPGIEVTPSGITARYGLPLPSLAVGVFSLENIRLDAFLDLPFVGRPLEIGFAFCSRQAPFRLTVSMLGGGGFFGIVLTPKRVAVLEAALEFGAAVSLDFGVASGSLSVMAGIYFRLEADTGECRITGYFRARGEVDVLGLVSASVELCLDLSYESAGGTVHGRARITIGVHIGFWSQSVTLECEKRFAGSGPPPPPLAAADPVRPPTFAEMTAPYPDPVTGLRRDPVDEYCTAFATVR